MFVELVYDKRNVDGLVGGRERFSWPSWLSGCTRFSLMQK